MNKKQIAITLGIMCFILTVAICVQLKTVENTTATASQSLKENGLRDEVLKWKERYDNVYGELTKSNKDLEEIRKTLLNRGRLVLQHGLLTGYQYVLTRVFLYQ